MVARATYGDRGKDLWAIVHRDEQAREDAERQWESFASVTRQGDVTIATLIRAAKDMGFPFSTTLKANSSSASAGWSGDVKNGKLFAEMHRDKLLSVHETEEWLQFIDNVGWLKAEPHQHESAAKQVLQHMRQLYAQRVVSAPDASSTKRMATEIERTSRAPHLRAMVEMAKSEPGMTVRAVDFDSAPMLLGVLNGVMDLTACSLTPTRPSILVSKRCAVAYDSAATCTRFDRFIDEILPDAGTRGFLQRFFGYCLTGSVDAQLFVFMHGEGANGKSVLLETVAYVLGDYATKIPTDMLMQHNRNPQGPSPDIVGLKGRRFVYANETEEGRRLAEARVKDLTGGDTSYAGNWVTGDQAAWVDGATTTSFPSTNLTPSISFGN